MRAAWYGAALCGLGALAFGNVARAADDDLSVVRRAVADARPADDAPPAHAATPARKGGEPQWLKVRIQEKREKKARVSVNLPLSLVRVIGSDWPLDGRCRQRKTGDHHCLTFGEALRSLESGQEIVEVDDEDSTVRIWVE
jgi:hypothetical protein